MRSLMLTFAFLFSGLSYSQELSLALELAPEQIDESRYAIKTSKGYIYIGGSVRKNPDTGLDENGFGIFEADEKGNFFWKKNYYGNQNEEILLQGKRIALIKQNKIFIATELYKSDTVGIRIFELTLEGELLKTKDILIPYSGFSPRLNGIIAKGDDFAIYGDRELNSEKNVFIIQLDSIFNIKKEHYYGEKGESQRVPEIEKLSSGEYVMIYVETEGLLPYIVLTRLYKNFKEVKKVKILPSKHAKSFYEIVETEDLGFILLWEKDLFSSNPNDFSFPSAIYKLDSTFTVEWEYVFSSPYAKQAVSISRASNGNIIGVGGTDYWAITNLLPETSGFYGWSFMLDPNGNLVWERSIADRRYIQGGIFNDIVETNDGFLFVGVIDDVFPNSEPYINDSQVWILTLDENGCWNNNCGGFIVIDGSSSIKNTNLSNTNLAYFHPNPSQNEILIEWNHIENNSKRHIEIFDESGKVLIQSVIDRDRLKLNISQFKAGLYFIKCYLNGYTYSIQKLIIQK